MTVASDDSNNFFCPVCRLPVDKFLAHRGRERARCPRCGVLERHRFLGYLIDRLSPLIVTSSAVLDVAPQPGLRDLLIGLVGNRYVSIDFETVRPVSVRGDLTGLPFSDGCFDFVICYHVLEHVLDDRAAMSELARVMSPRALMLLQVPLRHGEMTEEDPSAPPEERTIRFGQADHLRMYGEDLPDLLHEHGIESARSGPATFLDGSLAARFAVGSTSLWICRRADRWSRRRPTKLPSRSLVQQV